MFGREVFEEEGYEVGGVGAGGHESVVFGRAEREVGGYEGGVAAGAEDGDYMCWEGGVEEEGKELGCYSGAGVVEEGHECIETFACF